MATTQTISLLGYALLGLIQQEPDSGYGLRRIFTHTPMGSFSDSPGAIYPALGRLERDGLIGGTIENGAGLRRRKVFHITAEGLTALMAWVNQPVTREEVVQGMGGILLRFAFMDGVAGARASRIFLQSLQAALTDYGAELARYAVEHAAEMPLSGRLALDHGVRTYRASMEWAVHALAVCDAADPTPAVALADAKSAPAQTPKPNPTR